MLPLRDRNPSATTPFVVYGLIAANVLLFLYEVSLPKEALNELFRNYAVVPDTVYGALKGEQSAFGGMVVPAFSSMFLHGGWLHLIGNMWYLWIFGDNVEDRLGHVGFLAFYLGTGLAAMALQVTLSLVFAAGSDLPNLGASGAIAGVLGLYALTWPRARVLTLVPFYLILVVEVPAFVLLGFWFVIQFMYGATSIGAQYASGGVAYGAHVGGFVAGALAGFLLGRPRERRAGRRS